MEHSITGSEVAELISCKKQDVYNSASYGQMIRKEFYVEVVDRPLSRTKDHAFNSPMRPFVLATTSIGQEGLDFHNYCRVIMHWNLPSNPIDVGRILRTFKIKKNVEVTDNGKIII